MEHPIHPLLRDGLQARAFQVFAQEHYPGARLTEWRALLAQGALHAGLLGVRGQDQPLVGILRPEQQGDRQVPGLDDTLHAPAQQVGPQIVRHRGGGHGIERHGIEYSTVRSEDWHAVGCIERKTAAAR